MLQLIQDMKVKKGIAICGRRGGSHTSNLKPMKNGKRSFKQDISKRENMGYDQESDTYVCHAGRELRVLYLKKQRSKSGYESEVTVYECEDCTGCPYKEKMHQSEGEQAFARVQKLFREV